MTPDRHLVYKRMISWDREVMIKRINDRLYLAEIDMGVGDAPDVYYVDTMLVFYMYDGERSRRDDHVGVLATACRYDGRPVIHVIDVCLP